MKAGPQGVACAMPYENLFCDHPKHSCLPPSGQIAIRAVAKALSGKSVLPKPKAKRISLELLAQAFSQLAPEIITRAEPEIRAIAGIWPLWWYSCDHTKMADKKGFARKIQELDANPELAMLYLFHGDGRLRQEALSRLSSEMMSPFLFAAISTRLNDWAPPVRLEAEACMTRICTPDTFTKITPAIPYLCLQIKTWLRWEETRAAYDQIEASPEVAAFMARHLRVERRGKLARQLLSLLRNPAMDIHLPLLASQAATPAIRTIAYVTLLKGQAVWPIGKKRKWVDKVYGISVKEPVCEQRSISITVNLLELALEGAQDRSVFVRREVAYWLLTSNMDAPEVAQILSQDKYPSIRRIISFYQRKQAENA